LQYVMRREFLKTDSCDFALSSEDFMEEQIAMILPKNSPYLDLFNLEITRLHQMGLIERWTKEYLPPKDRCTKQSSLIEVVNHTVNLDDMQGCFAVLLLGFGAGFFFLIIEAILRWYWRRKERNIFKPYID
jgi:glutamate receptor, ionotropic, invertebrate